MLEPGRPELITEKLVQLPQDEKLKERMGMAGRKFVEKFDWDVIAERTLQVYQKAIGDRRNSYFIPTNSTSPRWKLKNERSDWGLTPEGVTGLIKHGWLKNSEMT